MRFLFTSLPINSHFNFSAPLAQKALDCGHHVSYAVAPSFCESVEKCGFCALPCGLNWDDPSIEPIKSKVYSRNNLALLMGTFFAGVVACAAVEDLIAISKSYQPDVIIADITDFAGWVVAESIQTPIVFVHMGFQMPVDFLRENAGAELAALREFVGLCPDLQLDTLHRANSFVFAPPSYQPADYEQGPAVYHFKPELFDNPDYLSLPDWVLSLPEQPTVYVSTGTSYHIPMVLERLVNNVADEPANFIVATGVEYPPETFANSPENVRVVRYIPQSLLLPHCDAIATHAAWGPILGALLNACPMLLIPMVGDHYFHARQCETLGVANTLPILDLMNGQNVRESLQRVLYDSVIRDAVEKIKNDIECLPELDQAVQFLERMH